MGRGDCVIMHNAAYLPKEIQQIFVSGYGNLSAKTYRDLKNAGIFMCDQIQESCAADQQAEVCRLGQVKIAIPKTANRNDAKIRIHFIEIF